jgi:enoyl-CoA hydratase
MAEAELLMRSHAEFAGVTEIVINRPRRKNALTLGMWEQLQEMLTTVNEDTSVRVLVLRGVDDTAFCAGADITEFPQVRRDRASAVRYNAATDGATRLLSGLRPVTVAAIQGVCYGGGTQLASACDIRLASAHSTFAITPVKVGFVYGFYETRLLTQLVGIPRARDLLLTGRSMDADEALRIGLVTHVYAPHLYQQQVASYVASLLAASPNAQLGMKEMLERIAAGQTSEDESTRTMMKSSLDHPDYQEGVHAFLNKRKPRF